jgi:hypothetical protein
MRERPRCLAARLAFLGLVFFAACEPPPGTLARSPSDGGPADTWASPGVESGAGADAAKGSSAFATVELLASPTYSGRKSGTEGGTLAALFLVDRLRACGVRPYVDRRTSYLHAFKVTPIVHTGRMEMTATSASGPSSSLVYRDEWRPGRTSPGSDLTAPLAFAGYGIDSPFHPSYQTLDAKGKVVLVLKGCPPGIRGDNLCGDNAKVARAADHGAAAVVLVTEDEMSVARWGGAQGFQLLAIPLAIATWSAAGRLLPAGRSLPDLRAQLAAGPVAFDTGSQLRLLMSRTVYHDVDAYNVLGVIEGQPTAAATSGGTVMAGAHYDHLGYDQPPSSYFPGAFDNASGTAAVLDAACRLARRGTPRRSLLFAFFGAEEDGLIGSTTLLQTGVVDPKSLYAFFNLDMVGGRSSSNEVEVDLSEAHDATFRPVLALLLGDLGYHAGFGVISTGSSDHAPFVARGVRTAYLWGPDPPDLQYHTLRDVPEQICPRTIETLSRVLADVMWHLASPAPWP